MQRKFTESLIPSLVGTILGIGLLLPGLVGVFLFGHLAVVLIFGILFLALGFLMGRGFPEQTWKSGLGLSIGYLMWLLVAIAGIYSFNRENEGTFVTTEFFPAAALLYLSPVAVACASAYLGSNVSSKSSALLIAALTVSCAATIYVGYRSTAGVEQDDVTFDLVENSDLHLNALIKCERMTNKKYMLFFNTDRTTCNYTTISIVKKPAGQPLPTSISVAINEREESIPITPQEGIWGTSNSFRQDLDNTKVWIVDIPWLRIARSEHAKISWGQITADLGEAELNRLREVLEKYRD